MKRSYYVWLALGAVGCWAAGEAQAESIRGIEEGAFFESRIRPALIAHCYPCHSASAAELQGSLRLDHPAGWQAGGDSGEPAIVPRAPEKSLLLKAMRHAADASPMPPARARLPDGVVADFEAWIAAGAYDPRQDQPETTPEENRTWDDIYLQRRRWWSLQPLERVAPPSVQQASWVRNEVDPFILARLEAHGLSPAPPADRRVLARRLSYALTGLPPPRELVDALLADPAADAEARYVERLLDSPHFGEHWARHWMDLVHYADTHGYEWDVPAKNAWRYRDYLIRAFNNDVSIQQLILEHLAGDLIPPRIDPDTGQNESLHGPMALRLGERRHGDNAAAEGVTQEAITNVIDTVGKAFLASTIACAQCHDHKLDAIAQADYYALAGVFMNSRWITRPVEAVDPNLAVLAEMRALKQQIRNLLAERWLASRATIRERLRQIPAGETSTEGFPESLIEFWQRQQTAPLSVEAFEQERQRRVASNQTHLQLAADFRPGGNLKGWRWDGWGMQHGLVDDGALVVAEEGDSVAQQILPAGRWSHVWSSRLAAAVRSPLLETDPAEQLTVELAGGKHAAHALIVDHAINSERMQFIDQPRPGRLTVSPGTLDTLEGGVDQVARRVYLELATKSLNNYFPPRTAYRGLDEEDIRDPRSWLGVARVYRHPADRLPLDELTRLAPLFEFEGPWIDRFTELVGLALERWARGEARADDARLLDEALRAGLLPNELDPTSELAARVADYRAAEARLQPARTIGTLADWHEGRDERIAIRGNYAELGDETPRGNIRFLGGPAERANEASSGRLEFARSIASDTNPLTARVFVNRVWGRLFGGWIVETPDDFGHLGQMPSHPELLDHLAARFVEEGWSLKRLIRCLVNSAAWRQSGASTEQARLVDPDNRLWSYRPLRRLEAEAIRDSILCVSGRFDAALYGPPLDPYRRATDPAKRLFSGPLDGHGRRSIYVKMTLMDPPRLLSTFNLPMPKQTAGRRDVTNVPSQALTLLNDPLLVEMARHWARRQLSDGAATPAERAASMFEAAVSRPPRPDETARLIDLVRRSAALRKTPEAEWMASPQLWQDVAHTLFNLKEFIYVP